MDAIRAPLSIQDIQVFIIFSYYIFIVNINQLFNTLLLYFFDDLRCSYFLKIYLFGVLIYDISLRFCYFELFKFSQKQTTF